MYYLDVCLSGLRKVTKKCSVAYLRAKISTQDLAKHLTVMSIMQVTDRKLSLLLRYKLPSPL